MTSTVHVSLRERVDSSYSIVVGIRLPRALTAITADYAKRRIFIVTDSNVARHYRNVLSTAQSRHWQILTIPAGERSKTREMKQRLEDRLLASGADRDSVVIAFGGGVIGDLSGFVAATFMRGIPYIQIPTSLLAQVDSSVGGKVAVDHPLGKNLVGAFYQPQRVYIDVQLLRTLPLRQFHSGMAEVIKYGAILDSRFFEFLESHSRITPSSERELTNIVLRCCELKKNVVERDEKEQSYRRILNFGHTIGHAVEKESSYRLLHGEAIAIGMMAEAKLSAAICGFPLDHLDRLQKLIGAFKLPTTFPRSMRLGNIIQSTILDKKARDGQIRYTLIERIGKAAINIALNLQDAERILSE